MFTKREKKPYRALTEKSLSPNLLGARYAVRGRILIKANEYNETLKKPNNDLPFTEITYCNIGNPQRLGQHPLTYVRNVLALTTSPQLLNSEHAGSMFKGDEIARAKSIVESTPGILGGYTHSQGLDIFRKDIAGFVSKRDGTERPDIKNIFMTDGASIAIQNVMFALIRGDGDGIMIPIPQYPLYSASIVLFGGKQVDYMLTEESGWSVNVKGLQRNYDEAYANGVTVRAMVVINPGNPTGQVLTKKDQEEIVKFCHRNSVVLLADEVYQENIYDPNIKWNSFRKVAYDLGGVYLSEMELVTFNSVSKGFLGECGRRGGYMEFSPAFDEGVLAQMYKKASVNLCPNIDGQIVTGIQVNPPKEGDESYDLFMKERDNILGSLARRSKMLTSALDGLPNMSCNPSNGAMYAFPQVMLPEKSVQAAKEMGIEPDLLYCMELLDDSGICVVPGSGFCQKKGTFHFRSTFLPPENGFDEIIEKFKSFHLKFMKKYS